ncbi:MAG TPA: BamA/TamA family outer membrane protein [Armatimonadetes bacterium]|jgi:outer membrane protein insertion porin family|nr:BamA/TamA family outer membrane protein [Armatimonadota bacterium]
MRRKVIRWWFLTAALLVNLSGPGMANGVGAIDAISTAGVRVAEVEVRGNQQISRDAILAVVTARPGRMITREDLTRDMERLRSLGYFQSVGTPEVESTPSGARITYVVEEYPRVAGVRFEGNTALTDAELDQIIGVERGQLLNLEALSARLRAIENSYRARGYLARVGEVSVSAEGIVTIPIQEVRVAEVEIEGLRRVRPQVVERALGLKEGDLFNEQQLQSDFIRLQQFGLFEAIEPEVGFNAGGDALVTWNLREGRSRALNFGLSYSPQESLVGSIAFTENNFRGRAERLQALLNIGSIGGRVGGEVAYATPLLGENIAYNARVFSLVEYRFTQRLLFSPDTDTGRYFERHNGAQAGAARNLGRGRTLSLSGRFEDVQVFNLPPEFLAPGVPSLDSSLLAGSGEYITDRRNSILYPTTGTYTSFAADLGWVSRGSDEGEAGTLFKPRAEWRVFIPIDRERAFAISERTRQRARVLALRAMAGTSLGELPFFEQFFVGGANTLRGYREDRFWGEQMIVANAELRWPVGSGLIGVAFLDVGHAWGSDFQFTDTPGVSTAFRQSRDLSLQLGAGVGVRYLSPLGPLRLDLGYGDELRVHFTLGQTF